MLPCSEAAQTCTTIGANYLACIKVTTIAVSEQSWRVLPEAFSALSATSRLRQVEV